MGVATYAALRGLSLQSGSTYYATIQAVDFTGKSGYVVSRGVTIDATEPKLEWVELAGIAQFQTSLRLEWNPVRDDESDLVSLEWGLGTRLGSSDITGWREATLDQNTGVELNTTGLQLYEGQVVFASLKVQIIIVNV